MNNFDFSFFNPGSQKEADFLAGFIARHDVLQFFLAQLRNTRDGQAAKHHLVIAPRGYGKTSLLRRIKIAVREEAEFNARYIPLSFREEQHNVISLDLFWRNCLQSLLEAREDEQASTEELDELDKLWLKYAPRSELKRDAQDGEPAYAAFFAHCKMLGRRPVLLIDNLDTLLAGLDTHDWGLRTILQKKDGPILIAAASRHPDSLTDHNAAFFDFFRITTLPPLGDHEVKSCLSELARKRGKRGEPVRRMLETDPGRISALNTMAGGNPRTLLVLYAVLESHMSDDVLAQLGAMLDAFTGWYQARTEELPLQSRAVFDALALNWDPMTAAELGKATGLDTPTVSSHLSRMEKGGYVEPVSLSKTRKSRNGYQVSERFYNIWYLMRNGSRRTREAIKFLTVFLRSCFSREERHAMAMDKLRNGVGRLESALALAASIGDSRLRQRLLDSVETSIRQTDHSDDARMLLEEIRKEIKPKKRRMTHRQKQAKELLEQSLQLLKEDQLEKAEAACRQAIKLDEHFNVLWFLLGSILEHDRYAEAEAAYRKAISLEANWFAPWMFLGRLLIDVERFEDAEAAHRKAISLTKDDAEPWLWLGVLFEEKLGRYQEAEFAYRESIKLNGKDWRAWDGLGDVLSTHLDRPEEAEAAYREAVSLNEGATGTWMRLGRLLQFELKKFEAAEEAYRKAIMLNDKDAATWSLLATVQIMNDREDEAEVSCRQAIALDENWVYPKAILASLVKQRPSRLDEAERLYRQALALDEKDAFIWQGYADCLVQLERYEEAERAYRQAILCGNKGVNSRNRLGNLLQDTLGRYEEAWEVYKQGLEIEPQKSILLANSAYVCALHLGLPEQARDLAEQASPGLPEVGRHLLNAMLAWSDGAADAASRGWAELHQAVTCGDEKLWSNYVDDMQRILAYAIIRGDGEAVRNWMEAADYPMQFAPLYHAYRAVLEGEDHLLTINPEVRGVAEKIHRDLARMVNLSKPKTSQKRKPGNKR